MRLLLAALMAFSSAAPAAPAPPTLSLSPPTGPLPVGVTTTYLRDDSRADPWVPSRRRELMVSLWYPAASKVTATAPYVTPRESELILQGLHRTEFPGDALSTVRTNAGPDARPGPGRHPLVVLSPGFSLPRSSLTGLAEDLASRGYVVAGIDHAYESFAVTFPDGRVATCLVCDTDDYAGVARGRAADVSFVLDRLLDRGSAWRSLIDPRRIAMGGHSIGGAAAVAAMQADRRIAAGFDLDGSLFVPPAGLDRPFLLLGTESDHLPGGDHWWDEGWPQLTGWKRWVTVAGTGHFSFIDYPELADQVGGVEPGMLSGARSTQITSAYAAAFLDRHLRHLPRPLLDGPSPRFPEVTFSHLG
ncbi:lipase [Actinoplanes sp. NPDC049548]|uniref:alpha/beta hydrolase family protein n=1 Tax=Actinoplanes sp. NPDC049548 TaxID=3155152 RepID=UPI00344AEC28